MKRTPFSKIAFFVLCSTIATPIAATAAQEVLVYLGFSTLVIAGNFVQKHFLQRQQEAVVQQVAQDVLPHNYTLTSLAIMALESHPSDLIAAYKQLVTAVDTCLKCAAMNQDQAGLEQLARMKQVVNNKKIAFSLLEQLQKAGTTQK